MKTDFREYNAPAGGWGSVRSLARRFALDGNPVSASLMLAYQNKQHGFACPSCAWAKPAQPHVFEFCENGAMLGHLVRRRSAARRPRWQEPLSAIRNTRRADR